MPTIKRTTRPHSRTAKPATRTTPTTRKTRKKPEVFSLRLFVAGHTPKSERAFANLTALCEKHLKGRYQVEVIDLLENPHLARGNQIVAIPTLEVKLPQGIQRPVQYRPCPGGSVAGPGRMTRRCSR
jgi:circadian clock protein KaiB